MDSRRSIERYIERSDRMFHRTFQQVAAELKVAANTSPKKPKKAGDRIPSNLPSSSKNALLTCQHVQALAPSPAEPHACRGWAVVMLLVW